MEHSHRRLLLAAVVLVGIFVQAASAEAPSAASPQQTLNPNIPLTTLAEWDAATDLIAQLAWHVHEVTGPSAEVAGHSLEEHWDRYVLRPEPKAQLDALRAQAQQQSEAADAQGLKATLAQASPLLNAEKYKAAVMMAFSTVAGSVHYQRDLLRPWLDRATDADRAAADAQTLAGHEKLVTTLAREMRATTYDTMFAKRLTGAARDSLAALNGERLRLVTEQSSLPNPVAVNATTRDTACPPPVPPAPDRDTPGLHANFPNSEDFYPPLAKMAQVEGAVTVRVTVSDTGCAVRAEIVGTSGAKDLDTAALALAMAGGYVPGSKEGKAVPGAFSFRVKFELRD